MASVKPFTSMSAELLAELAGGHCVAVTGLSNSGKSMLMRMLASPETEKAFQKAAGAQGLLIYIDCNRAVAISGQAFYEVVLRSILERLGEEVAPALAAELREYHQTITEADSTFGASLAFNLALSMLGQQLERKIVLLLDEFDEIYTALDERALLNLRALRDRFHDRLAFVTATIRSLPELRGETVEDEFAELFARFTFNMPLLEEAEAVSLLDGLRMRGLTADLGDQVVRIAGGHPGLMVAVAQVLAGMPVGSPQDLLKAALTEPQPRAECMKIWNQLTEDERAALISLAREEEAGLPEAQRRNLKALGLLREGGIFSPVFRDFVARKGQGPDPDARGVFLDADAGDVWVDGMRVPLLTDLEYRLLKLLDERRDKLTDKYSIVTAVWGEAYLEDVDDARVEKLISRLRSKIEPDPANPRYLITRRGRGYKLLSKPLSSVSDSK